MRDTSFMLKEISVMEQRYQAVLAVIRDGVPIVGVARRFDVSSLVNNPGLMTLKYMVPGE